MMSPIAEALKLTYEDYCLFPADGRRHEIIEGEHFVTPAPNLRHQAVIGRLHVQLSSHIAAHTGGHLFLAPCDVLLSDADIVQPDLVFVSAERAGILTEANIQGAPDLVIEVLSPSTRKVDLTVKRKLYERFAVGEFWVVDPDLESVRVFHLQGEGYGVGAELFAENGDVLVSTVLSRLALSVAAIFQS